MLVTNEYTLYVLTTAAIALGNLVYEPETLDLEQAKEYLSKCHIDEESLKDVIDAALTALKQYHAEEKALEGLPTENPPILH